MAFILSFVFLTVAGLAAGRNFYVYNNLQYTVWVGIQGNDDMPQPGNGGFILLPTGTVSNPVEICGYGTWSAMGRD
jgi:hypothetical protein